jgi:signal transduction histidine kinase
MLCICVWASLGRWLAETSGSGRPALTVLLGLILAGLLGAVAMATGVMPAPRLLVADMAKIIFAVTLLATMTSLTVHIIGLRRRHAQAVELQIAALEEEAMRSQELLVAEQNYARARDLASLRQKQLATASHDLKQPLASLRMTFATLAEDTRPEVAHRLNEALAYLEDLSAEYLRETTSSAQDHAADGADAADQPAPAPEAVEGEIYDLSIILETVQRMFNEEAISKGLQLRVVPTSLRIAVPAIVMMRIVSNLASNAVNYTERGRVLIGVRRRQADDRMWAAIEVIDTGPGISAPDLERLFDPYEKGEQSRGHGLGLAVCRELAAQNGLSLTVDSEPGRGTCMRLLVPVMPQAS